MIVRQELVVDVAAARAVQVAAFTKEPGVDPIEAPLLDALRACDGWVPALSLVAVSAGEVVGHCVTTLGTVGDLVGLGLGPIGVAPAVQGRGVGQALVHASLGAADALGYPFVALLGSPVFYGRFGFVTSTLVGIAPPEAAWAEHFQVRTLTTWDPAIAGTFQYSEPFQEM